MRNILIIFILILISSCKKNSIDPQNIESDPIKLALKTSLQSLDFEDLDFSSIKNYTNNRVTVQNLSHKYFYFFTFKGNEIFELNKVFIEKNSVLVVNYYTKIVVQSISNVSIVSIHSSNSQSVNSITNSTELPPVSVFAKIAKPGSFGIYNYVILLRTGDSQWGGNTYFSTIFNGQNESVEPVGDVSGNSSSNELIEIELEDMLLEELIDILSDIPELTLEEWRLALANPRAAIEIYKAYKEALTITISQQLGGNTNGIGDAFRHALWAALAKYKLKILSSNGTSFNYSGLAEQFLTAHEHRPFDNSGHTPLIKSMDLYNNTIGFNLFWSTFNQTSHFGTNGYQVFINDTKNNILSGLNTGIFKILCGAPPNDRLIWSNEICN